MYLKNIKIVGFKSFADKTNIDFKDGITGIVGPNGSGKSNVVDAVRWVLGEQSVKTLRGDGSMTDIIFSGSKSRNPASSASVTLVFDNVDHYFPIDYAELSIKRVVYKTGENEYYLNNERCRLKDIMNLIIDTGMGRDAFNIISQGNIQDILSNKPEERRVIFEEASGVLKYKKRKEEALRKLDKTHDNIDRINDITNELESQIEPLKEQSEKAHIYVDAKSELENVEIALIVHDVENMNSEYRSSKTQIDNLNDEIISISESNSTQDADLEKEKVALVHENSNLHQKQKELVELSSKVERLNGQKLLVVERGRYDSEDAKVHDHILLLKEGQLKIKNEIESTAQDIKIKRDEVNCINQKIDQLRLDMVSIKKSVEDLEQERNKYVRGHLELNHKKDILETSIENNSSLPYGIKNVLGNPKLRGIHNIIGRLISFDSKYSTAIDISLGASSLFVVTDNDVTAKDAISYLKSNNLGRVTFFPLNVIKERHIDMETYNMIKDNLSFIDMASNLLEYDDKYKNIILNQLGNVIIASDIDGANQIGKMINYRYKIVTLDGELLHVGGSITGGTSKKSNSIISEKYELESINRKLILVDEKIKDIDLKHNDIETMLKEFQLKDYNQKLEKSTLDESIANKINVLKELKIKEEETKNELHNLSSVIDDTVNSEEQNIIDAYYKTLGEKEELEKTITSISKKVASLNESIEERESAYKKNNEFIFKKQNVLKELEIKVNRLDVKLDMLLNTLNEEYTMTFEKAKKDYILVMDEAEARKKVNSLKNTIKNLGVVNIAAIEEYDRVSKRYDFLTAQKNDLFKAENTLLDIIKEMDLVMKEAFEETYKAISEEFKVVFKELFGGGEAYLKLTDPDNMLETGVDIIALPPGKKLQHISLLSGGEKALTAIALLFAILRVRPVPFCILDEVEAALDDVNVQGYAKFLRTFKDKMQFIIITHKKKTMEYVDVLYGITMQESGVSKLVSVKLESSNF
ncbi:MAG: chromosome segregation protein SMC [Bacilli bacterium]|nr:chromosome segregation protein SMC [Bacilli bacterium]MDD3305029.1 chromosome segregation protein SMC [Bacilli bacterium]MDD4053640.1 chromosome segregation protein SMC [Bacilli bacterium]MDD4411139.1 chromosome segregation protein SMC [Bacilli bacterium]